MTTEADVWAAIERSPPEDEITLLALADFFEERDPDLAYALRWAAKKHRRPRRVEYGRIGTRDVDVRYGWESWASGGAHGRDNDLRHGVVREMGVNYERGYAAHHADTARQAWVALAAALASWRKYLELNL